jgi:hypothetical protein
LTCCVSGSLLARHLQVNYVGCVYSRRQQRAEGCGHDARADAGGCVDQALARKPCLEFRRRATAEEIAHGERVVERWT